MAALDVLTGQEARDILGVGALDTGTAAANLERLVTAASQRLDQAVGPVVTRAVSEFHDGGRRSIELSVGPVLSVSSVVEYQGTVAVDITQETQGVEPDDGWYGYRYEPNRALLSGVLVRRTRGCDTCWWAGAGNIAVTYTAGRTSQTAVDARYKEAAGLILRNLWRPYESSVGQVGDYDVPVASMPSFALPNAVKDLLRDEMQSSVGFG